MLMLRLAWRNIWRQPRRTQLTLAAMVFANVLLVFSVAMETGMYAMMIDNTLRLGSGHYQVQAEDYLDHPAMYKTVENGIDKAEALRAQIGDVVAARAQSFVLFASEQRTYAAQLTGVEIRHEPMVSSLPGLVKAGHYLVEPKAHEVVIGRVLARNLKVGVGDELTLLGSGRDGSIAADIVTVVGLFDTGNQQIDRLFAHMPIATFQQVFSMQDSVHAVVVTARTLGESHALAGQIKTAPGEVLLNWQQLEPGLMQAIKADISSAVMMYMVLVVLCAFSVLNTMLMTVLERTREFGIFMALGLRPSQISRLIFIEAAILAALGLLLGIILGGLITGYFEINGMVIPGYEEAAARFNMPERVYPSVDVISLFSGPVGVFVGALLASIYPALKILRLQPLEAMRART